MLEYEVFDPEILFTVNGVLTTKCQLVSTSAVVKKMRQSR